VLHKSGYLLLAKKWLFLLVRLYDFSGNNHNLKAFYVIHPLMIIVPFLEQDLRMVDARFHVIIILSFDLYDNSRYKNVFQKIVFEKNFFLLAAQNVNFFIFGGRRFAQ